MRRKGTGISGSFTYTLRRLTPADAAAYRTLRLRGLREHADAFTSSYEEDRAKALATAEARLAPESDDMVWGAFSGDALAGVVGLGREARAKNRHKAVVFGMYVAPEHSGNRVGTALLARVIEAARTCPGIEQLVLTVTDGNTRARRLYETAGFRSFGVEPRAIRVGDRYYGKQHMILFLTPP